MVANSCEWLRCSFHPNMCVWVNVGVLFVVLWLWMFLRTWRRIKVISQAAPYKARTLSSPTWNFNVDCCFCCSNRSSIRSLCFTMCPLFCVELETLLDLIRLNCTNYTFQWVHIARCDTTDDNIQNISHMNSGRVVLNILHNAPQYGHNPKNQPTFCFNFWRLPTLWWSSHFNKMTQKLNETCVDELQRELNEQLGPDGAFSRRLVKLLRR